MLLEAVAVRGLAAGALAILVSRSPLTAWLRDRATGLAAEGLRCPYCCAFWTAGGLCFVYPAAPLPLLWLASWGCGALVAGAIDRLYGD